MKFGVVEAETFCGKSFCGSRAEREQKTLTFNSPELAWGDRRPTSHSALNLEGQGLEPGPKTPACMTLPPELKVDIWTGFHFRKNIWKVLFSFQWGTKTNSENLRSHSSLL